MDSPAISPGGNPAKMCPRVTHNLHSPDGTLAPGIDPDLQRLFDESQSSGEIVASMENDVPLTR